MEKLRGGSMKILKWFAFYIISISMMFSALRAAEDSDARLLQGLTEVTQEYRQAHNNKLMPLGEIYDYILNNGFAVEQQRVLRNAQYGGDVKQTIVNELGQKGEISLESICKFVIQKLKMYYKLIIEGQSLSTTEMALSRPVVLTDGEMRQIEQQKRSDAMLQRSVERQEKSLATGKWQPSKEYSTINFSPFSDPHHLDSGVVSGTPSRADSALGDELLIEESMIFDAASVFNEELREENIKAIRKQGNGNIKVLQSGKINWFKINFPIFDTTDLIKTYNILFALANCDDTLPALVNTLNNCSATVFGKQYKKSARRVLNTLIGDRAATLVENGNLNWKDKLRLELLERYFYQEEYELEATENEPFKLDELTRFRDEAREIEEIRKRPLTARDAKIILGAAAAYGVGASYLIAPKLFNSGVNSAVDFVTKTLPSAVSLSNLQNVGQSALSSAWSTMPSLPFSSFLSR